jgi:hypothetical protein
MSPLPMNVPRHVAADVCEAVDGQAGHLTGPQPHHSAEYGDGVVDRAERAGCGEEGSELQNGEDLGVLQFAVHLRPGDAGTRIVGDEVLVEGQPVDGGDGVVVGSYGGVR